MLSDMTVRCLKDLLIGLFFLFQLKDMEKKLMDLRNNLGKTAKVHHSVFDGMYYLEDFGLDLSSSFMDDTFLNSSIQKKRTHCHRRYHTFREKPEIRTSLDYESLDFPRHSAYFTPRIVRKVDGHEPLSGKRGLKMLISGSTESLPWWHRRHLQRAQSKESQV